MRLRVVIGCDHKRSVLVGYKVTGDRRGNLKFGIQASIRFTAFLSKKPVWVDDRSGMSTPRVKMPLYVQHHGKYTFEIAEGCGKGSNRTINTLSNAGLPTFATNTKELPPPSPRP